MHNALKIGISSWLRQQTTPIPLDKLALQLSAFAEQDMGGSSGAVSESHNFVQISKPGSFNILKIL